MRSWPPVDRLAIRWAFPTWQLDSQADPRKLWGAKPARERTNRENKDIHLDEDRQNIVNVMVRHRGRKQNLHPEYDQDRKSTVWVRVGFPDRE